MRKYCCIEVLYCPGFALAHPSSFFPSSSPFPLPTLRCWTAPRTSCVVMRWIRCVLWRWCWGRTSQCSYRPLKRCVCVDAEMWGKRRPSLYLPQPTLDHTPWLSQPWHMRGGVARLICDLNNLPTCPPHHNHTCAQIALKHRVRHEWFERLAGSGGVCGAAPPCMSEAEDWETHSTW